MSAWLWLAVTILATACGQIIFKHASLKRSLLMTALAVGVFCLAPLGSYMALHQLSLATVYVSTALAQLVVVIGSMALFGERYATRQWLGLALILGGVVVFNASSWT